MIALALGSPLVGGAAGRAAATAIERGARSVGDVSRCAANTTEHACLLSFLGNKKGVPKDAYILLCA